MGLRRIFTDRDDSEFSRTDVAWTDVERSIVKMYVDDDGEKARRDRMRRRRLLYDCEGVQHMGEVIDRVFKDERVRQLRREVAPYAKYNNVLHRLVSERARVYAKRPKSRGVADADAQARYKQLQKDANLDLAMRCANQLVELENDVWLQFRIRNGPDGPEPRIDVVAQDSFYAIHHPNDRTQLVGVIIDQTPRWARVVETDPHFLLLSNDEMMKLDKKGRIIRESIAPNPYGTMPGLLLHSGYRESSLLDASTGEDMVAAHVSVWLLELMMVKESKSQTRQVALLGETGQSARGQAQDSEADLVLGEGVGATTLDRGVDLERFRSASDAIIDQVAANKGIPPSVLRHAGATSGYEIDLRRIPLEEIREDQIEIFRDAERRFAEIQSLVVETHALSQYAFTTEGWAIDFAEMKRPLSQKELYDVRRTKRAMGHSDAFLEAQEDNPDFTPEMAFDWVLDRMRSHGLFIDMARVRDNVPADADADNPGQSPEDNGAMGQAQTPSPDQLQ